MGSKSLRHPFSGARSKLRRALFHIESLEAAITAFYGTSWYEASLDSEHGLRVTIKGKPKDCAEIVGDALHNVRASLDLAAVESINVTGGDSTDARFPFCKSEQHLDETIVRSMSRSNRSVRELIRSLRPFSEGNRTLYALHALDIQDKHHDLVAFNASMLTPAIEVVTDQFGHPVGFAENNLQLRIVPGSTPSVCFVFPDGTAMAGRPLLNGLRELLTLATSIVDEIEKASLSPSECARLAGVRHRW
jgi:hypothetical protein